MIVAINLQEEQFRRAIQLSLQDQSSNIELSRTRFACRYTPTRTRFDIIDNKIVPPAASSEKQKI
jgi:Tfp pilus assembly protein PilF